MAKAPKSASRGGSSALDPGNPIPTTLSELRSFAGPANMVKETAITADLLSLMTNNAPPPEAEIRSFSPLIKLKTYPTGKWINVRVKGLFNIPPKKAGQKDGCGVDLVPIGRDQGFALPGVATLKMALQISGDAATGWKSPYLGRNISLRLNANKIPSNEEGKTDSWNFSVAILPKVPTV